MDIPINSHLSLIAKLISPVVFYFILGVLISPSLGNIIENGDFETGEILPWTCKQAHCETSQKFLTLTKRTENWSGPHQLLNQDNFMTASDLIVTFGFDLQSNEMITANWKMKIIQGDETKYFSILT